MAVQAKPGVQERILLHLLDYSDFKDSIEVPFALSQMGIANAVAIARSNVPRAIAGLKDQGILVERQAHVKGVEKTKGLLPDRHRCLPRSGKHGSVSRVSGQVYFGRPTRCLNDARRCEIGAPVRNAPGRCDSLHR